MNTQIDNEEIILNQHGEPTEILKPDFGDMAFVDPSNFPDLEGAEVGFNVQAESFEFKQEGETLRAVFNGFTLWTVKDQVNEGQYKQVQTAILQTKTGIKGNMGANLIKQLQLVPVGTSVQITYKGEQKTNGSRKVKVYEVVTLRVPRVNVSQPQLPPTLPQPKHNELVKVENINQETGAPEPEIRMVNPMDYDSVNYAAKTWNVEASQAAREIAKLKLGHRIEWEEFKQIVNDGLNIEA